MGRAKILIVDDEESIQNSLSSILSDEGYTVKCCSDAECALKLFDREEFDVVLLDIWLPQMDGLKLFELMRAEKREEEVILISGHGTIEQAVRATKIGAFDFLEKPLSLERVVVAVSNAKKKKELLERESFYKSELRIDVELIGESSVMQKLKEQIKLAAPSDGRVLIYGENGTGKELVARSIHQQSRRAAETFIELNCAAIPQELIESELFGHKKGSFTGALENKKGKFLLADGGTLFLDEVGDMSLITQAKVLRAIEEQTIEPVGGSESIKVDVRVIAATNKDLEQEISSGRFREDLYYRLNVIRISLPSLRERKEDIPLLFSYYLDYFSKKYKKTGKTVTDKSYKILNDYRWPGNIRELKNIVERVIIMHQGNEIGPEDLFLSSVSGPEHAAAEVPGSLREAKDSFERDFIIGVLKQNGYNVSRTAEVLGIERRHLYRKMASLRIDKEEL
jgi:two-component system, NtrC family, nitrogen regulation response regulator NtrX